MTRCGYTSGRSSAQFDSPDQFRPERWIRGHQDRHNSNSFAYLPFGHGKRSCIGERFARMEMWVLIVKLIQKYRLENLSGEVGTITNPTVRPSKPVILAFHPR